MMETAGLALAKVGLKSPHDAQRHCTLAKRQQFAHKSMRNRAIVLCKGLHPPGFDAGFWGIHS